ncbi:MAG: hypothetical protein OEY66_09545 [Gammaproteobacteria bacterium]|nr:hypothetical protein [Gammaproteobacteria bacterium]
MEGISDIKISGLDQLRPPQILKQPYINLFFELSHKAPKEWCDDFNRLIGKRTYPVKIDPPAGLFIETWVRKAHEIEAVLDSLKKVIITCNLEYIARIEAERNAVINVDFKNDKGGEQGELNKIIADLNFDD